MLSQAIDGEGPKARVLVPVGGSGSRMSTTDGVAEAIDASGLVEAMTFFLFRVRIKHVSRNKRIVKAHNARCLCALHDAAQ